MAISKKRYRRVVGKAADASTASDSSSDDTGAPLQPNSPRPCVLVVDDEPSIRDLLSKMLALADYNVDVASDGQAALERFRLGGYNLLITDLRMPGMDGMSVIHEARRLHADLPIIIITGFLIKASAIEAADLGISGYLTKPFRVPKVLKAAAQALGE